MEKNNYSIAKMCRWLDVSRSGFYAWESRPMSVTKKYRETLLSLIRDIFVSSRQTYGHRRVRVMLKNSGHHISLGRVVALMREAGLVSKQRKVYKRTTIGDRGAVVPIDVIKRNFTATGPGRRLVGDITYIKTGEGWLYVSTVIDLYSKKIVGWAMAPHMRTDLVCDALMMAKKRNGIKNDAVFHSDRGSQYTSNIFAQYCDDVKRKGRRNRIRIRRSMGNTGVCWDNALAESFFGVLKNEMVHHEQFATRAAAKAAIFDYIEVFYNRQRIHSGLGYRTPQQAEDEYWKTHTKGC